MANSKTFCGHLATGLSYLQDHNEYQVWYLGQRELFKGNGLSLKYTVWSQGAEGWISFACQANWKPRHPHGGLE